ncbi:unnamed protein product [Alopecurus aequalis]
MPRSPALHLAVVALLGFCCLVHASTAAVSLPPAAPAVLQKTEAIPASRGAGGQAILARDADYGGVSRRMEMEMELEDYPGSGANDRHSPWRQERRN